MAIAEAQKAAEIDEVPIGAVIIDSGCELLSAASNRTIIDSDPTAHAEILAIRQAAAKIGNYRLTDTTLYTTIEPCVMCAGAIVNARIKRLVFAARDDRFGAVETHFNLCSSPLLNHRLEITSNILADRARHLIQTFFRSKRIS